VSGRAVKHSHYNLVAVVQQLWFDTSWICLQDNFGVAAKVTKAASKMARESPKLLPRAIATAHYASIAQLTSSLLFT